MNRKFLFLLGFLLIAVMPVFGLSDSIGIKTVNGIKYIVHQVDKGQGLYAISRRYNVSVAEIEAVNENVENLSLNQEILIPFPIASPQENIVFHKVEKGETLYRISKLYNVDVEDLKKWNKLADNSIHEGDIIKIILSGNTSDDQNVVVKPKEVSNDKLKSLKPGEIVEEGIATYIEDPSLNSRKALALHKKAPIGTVIEVTNLMNGESVFVKIVGNLPEDAAQSNEIIKLSKYTAKKLKIRDQLTRVRLNYFLE